jgi:hypothetical protein
MARMPVWFPDGPRERREENQMADPTPDSSPDHDTDGKDDLKARMREALERKNAGRTGVAHPAGSKEKAHGSEVVGGGPRMHRRKAGGGGS